MQTEDATYLAPISPQKNQIVEPCPESTLALDRKNRAENNVSGDTLSPGGSTEPCRLLPSLGAPEPPQSSGLLGRQHRSQHPPPWWWTS